MEDKERRVKLAVTIVKRFMDEKSPDLIDLQSNLKEKIIQSLSEADVERELFS